MLKRQLLDMESHKAFTIAKHLQLLSDVYMYKNLKECNAMFKELEPGIRGKISKDNIKDLRLSELTDLL